MIKKMYRKLRTYFSDSERIIKGIDEQKILNAKLLILANQSRADLIFSNITLAEFKVFSQFGDDGIIQFLINNLAITKKIFVEFGVEDYRESNTRFLLVNDNWSGLVMDGSKKHINYIKKDDIYWKQDITAVSAFITRENINSILKENGLSGEIGLLHIDVDGNDYWIWQAITEINPVIVIMEYNSVFGIQHPWTIPYTADFFRGNAHHSNLYYGASLTSLYNLAKEKGYIFIGCNSNGNNAYFIRKDRNVNFTQLSPEAGYIMSKFREARDASGNMTHIGGNERIKVISGMPVVNTDTMLDEIIN